MTLDDMWIMVLAGTTMVNMKMTADIRRKLKEKENKKKEEKQNAK